MKKLRVDGWEDKGTGPINCDYQLRLRYKTDKVVATISRACLKNPAKIAACGADGRHLRRVAPDSRLGSRQEAVRARGRRRVTLVSVGDSIVHAEDSWAAWLARAMGADLRRASANGARADDALEQVQSLAGQQVRRGMPEHRQQRRPVRLGRRCVRRPARPDRGHPRRGRRPGGGGHGQPLAGRVPRRRLQHPAPGRGGERRDRRERRDGRRRRRPARGRGCCNRTGSIPRSPASCCSPTGQRRRWASRRLPSTLADQPSAAGRWAYHRVAAGQAPRYAVKRALRRPEVPGPARRGGISRRRLVRRPRRTAPGRAPWARCTGSRSTEKASSTVNAG